MQYTKHYHLPLFEANDRPTWLYDWNNTINQLDDTLHFLETGESDLPSLTEIYNEVVLLKNRMDANDTITNKTMSALAPVFNENTDYNKNQLVWQNNTLYIFNSDYTSSTGWSNADVTPITVSSVTEGIISDISNLKDRISTLENGGSDSLTEGQYTINDFQKYCDYLGSTTNYTDNTYSEKYYSVKWVDQLTLNGGNITKRIYRGCEYDRTNNNVVVAENTVPLKNMKMSVWDDDLHMSVYKTLDEVFNDDDILLLTVGNQTYDTSSINLGDAFSDYYSNCFLVSSMILENTDFYFQNWLYNENKENNKSRGIFHNKKIRMTYEVDGGGGQGSNNREKFITVGDNTLQIGRDFETGKLRCEYLFKFGDFKNQPITTDLYRTNGDIANSYNAQTLKGYVTSKYNGFDIGCFPYEYVQNGFDYFIQKEIDEMYTIYKLKSEYADLFHIE